MEKNKKCLIICNDLNIDIDYEKYDFIIGVEKGNLKLIKDKIQINLSIGDFDSVNQEEIKLIKDKTQKFIMLKPEKDIIDGEAAISYIINQKIKYDIDYIAQGKNIDVTFTLPYLINKYNITFLDGNNIAFKMKKGLNIIFEKPGYKYISFISLGKSESTIKKMKYNINKIYLNNLDTYALRNELIKNKKGYFFLKKGIIIIVYSKY